MKKLTGFINLCLLSALLIVLANCGKDRKTALKSAYWIYVNTDYDSSYWTNSYVKFSDSTLNICRTSNMKYRISKDSLWIYPLKINTKKLDGIFLKSYSFKILSLTNDSLILLTSDGTFPFYFTTNRNVYHDTMKFVNLLSIKEKPLKFQKIDFALANCSVPCPEMSLEIDAKGILRTDVRSRREQKEEFKKGQLNPVEMQLLRLRMFNVPFTADSIGSDTPDDGADIEFIFRKNNRRYVFFGGPTLHHYRLSALSEDLIQLTETVPLSPAKRVTLEAGFSPLLHAPALKFIPPINVDDEQ